MKTIILCGGIGYRLKEETEFKPKPMVLIGGKPILWHIMKIYAHYGYNEFIIALGYKGDYIKRLLPQPEIFSSRLYALHEIRPCKIAPKANNGKIDDFKITFVDTGLETLPGEDFAGKKITFLMARTLWSRSGDGVGDINITEACCVS